MSTLRSILLHLDASPRSAARLRLARELAALYEARVTALYAVTPRLYDLPLAMAEGSAEMLTVLRELDADRRRSARALFDRSEPGAAPSMPWRELNNEPLIPGVVRYAFYNDLLVLGQHDAEDTAALDPERSNSARALRRRSASSWRSTVNISAEPSAIANGRSYRPGVTAYSAVTRASYNTASSRASRNRAALRGDASRCSRMDRRALIRFSVAPAVQSDIVRRPPARTFDADQARPLSSPPTSAHPDRSGDAREDPLAGGRQRTHQAHAQLHRRP
jgi:nucleotide-binding universal stress UspA family protein